MSYTPPAYTNVGGSISTGYTPPPFTDVGGDVAPPDGTISPLGWIGEFGTASLVNELQILLATGLDALEVGAHTARLDAEFLLPSGAVHSTYGTPELIQQQRTLSPAGVDSAQLGGVAVTHWLQYAMPEGVAAGSVGAHAIGESPRTVSPPWWYSTVFGRPFVGEYLTLSPDGIGGAVGQPGVLGLLQTIRPTGSVHSLVGTQFVELDDRHLSPQGYAQTRIGAHEMVPMLRTVLHSAGIPQAQGIGVPSVIPMTLWPDGIWAGIAAERVTVSRSGDVLVGLAPRAQRCAVAVADRGCWRDRPAIAGQ